MSVDNKGDRADYHAARDEEVYDHEIAFYSGKSDLPRQYKREHYERKYGQSKEQERRSANRRVDEKQCHIHHVSDEESSRTRGIEKFIILTLKQYYRRVLPKFAAVFTVSPNLVDNLKKYTDKVFLVPNFPSITCRKSSQIQNLPKDNSIVYQGTIYTISNQEYIINAINEFETEEPIYYKIIGKILPEEKTRLENLDFKSKVRFTGWIPPEQLCAELEKSLAGIVVLDYDPICCGKEGQLGSNKLFEYMIAGLPVICTDFKLWKDLIIDKYKCGICVQPRNSDAIYMAMKYLYEHQDEAKSMGERGKYAIYNEFNWEIKEKEFVNLYSLIYYDE